MYFKFWSLLTQNACPAKLSAIIEGNSRALWEKDTEGMCGHQDSSMEDLIQAEKKNPLTGL